MQTLALFTGQPGLTEIILILAVVLLLFGARRLPGLARSLGQSLSEFKKGRQDGVSRDDKGAGSEEKPE